MAALVTILLAGCSGPSSDGPVKFSTSPDVACAPVPEYEHAAFAVNLPDNLRTDITLDSVTLIDPKGVRLVGTRLMPITSGPHLLIEKYPPTAASGREWAQSTKAIGTKVRAGSVNDLILQLRDDGAVNARMSGVSILYTANGTKFAARTHLSLEFKQAVHC